MEKAQRAQRAIFREKALKHYIRGNEETVLPRFISPPVMLSFWCLLGLLLLGSSIAWFYRVPVYFTTVGEVTMPTGHMLIVIVLPADQLSRLHPGLSVQLQLGQKGPQWQQTITAVEPRVLSPAEIRSRFGVDHGATLPVQQPAAVALIEKPAHLSDTLYAGSIVQVRIQVGSRRMIALLPGLSGLEGV